MRRLRFELARYTRSNSWSRKSRLQVRPPRQRHSTFCSITAASRQATRLRTRGIERERSSTDMDTIEPRSSFVKVNGIRLHTLDWGGHVAPIVILHATGFLRRIYRPLAERLRAIGHVYSYDQRGHGDSSSAPDGDYSWDATM